MTNLKIRIKNFLEDYNAYLGGLNDLMGGIDDIDLNVECKRFKDVKVLDLVNNIDLYSEWTEINEILLNL